MLACNQWAEGNQMVTRISISGVSERDIDLLFLEEFQSSPSFLKWFQDLVLGENSPNMDFISARRSVRYAFGEIDLEVVLAESSGKEVRFLIENKVNAGFQPQQAERYRESGNSHVASKDGATYYTVLIAPKVYFGKDSSTKGFDKALTYETIRDEWFEQATELGERRKYKIALLESAIEKGTPDYQPVEDAPVTVFWWDYWQTAKEMAPKLEMTKPTKKPSGAGFIYFRPRTVLPLGFDICHKFKKGCVDLHIKGWGKRLNEVDNLLRSHLHHDMEIVPAGASAAIRLEVPSLDPGRPFSDQQLNARVGLEAAERMRLWYIEKQQFIPSPVLKKTAKKAQG
jgi:hypothetical protein